MFLQLMTYNFFFEIVKCGLENGKKRKCLYERDKESEDI